MSLTSAADMGTGKTAYTGATAPATDPTVYDIDAIQNPASTVTALNSKGFHTICYIEVGTAGNYYSTTDEGVPTTYFDQLQAAGDLGSNDLDETYNGNEGNTGFSISMAQEESYMINLSNYMHSIGLAWVGKNLDDTGDSYAADMHPYADAVISEQCSQYSTCNLLSSYFGNKAIFNAEYSLSTSQFCPADNSNGINGTLFSVNLNGSLRTPCR